MQSRKYTCFKMKNGGYVLLCVALAACGSLLLSLQRSWSPAVSTLRLVNQSDEGAAIAIAGSDHYAVPNVVHYIWYNTKTQSFQFHNMLSILSVQKFIKPDFIYFHTNAAPSGYYWGNVTAIPNFRIVHRDPPTTLFGETLKKPHFETSSSNVDRIQILYAEGGIYLDLDVIVLKSFDDLRIYPTTVGLESSNKVCGGIVISAKRTPYLSMWLHSYLDDYKVDVWAYNSGVLPTKLWKRFPSLVHIENDTLHRPNCRDLNQIFGPKAVDWSMKYAIHLWNKRVHRTQEYKDLDFDNIRCNSTYCQIARHVLFDESKSIEI